MGLNAWPYTPCRVSGRVADHQIAERELLAPELPGVDFADHATAAPGRADHAEAQRIAPGLHHDLAEVIARSVGQSVRNRQHKFVGGTHDDLALVVEEDVPNRELLRFPTRLTDLGGKDDPGLVAGRVLLRERGDPQRHFRDAERRLQGIEQRLFRGAPGRRRRRQHECAARPDRDVTPPNLDVDSMGAPVAIARRLLHAQHVVREHFPGQAVKNVLTVADDPVQRATGAGGEIGDTRHRHVAVFGQGWPQSADPNVAPRHVHQQHVDRDPSERRGTNDGIQIEAAVDDESFRQQDERLRPLDDGQRSQEVAQAAQRIVAVPPDIARQRVALVLHLALAFLARKTGRARALAPDHLLEDPVIASL